MFSDTCYSGNLIINSLIQRNHTSPCLLKTMACNGILKALKDFTMAFNWKYINYCLFLWGFAGFKQKNCRNHVLDAIGDFKKLQLTVGKKGRFLVWRLNRITSILMAMLTTATPVSSLSKIISFCCFS